MTTVTLKTVEKLSRHCGDCTLCCKLVPLKADYRTPEETAKICAKMVEAGMAKVSDFRGMMPDFTKVAGERCQHQRRTGCAVYDRRPFGCRYWNCRWLVNDDTGDLRRPDRSHYVIDIMPDFVTLFDNETGYRRDIQVVQIWVDPGYRDAWRDPALLAYLERRGLEGTAALIRFSSSEGFTLFPPSMSEDGQWHEVHRGEVQPERTPEEYLKALGGIEDGEGSKEGDRSTAE